MFLRKEEIIIYDNDKIKSFLVSSMRNTILLPIMRTLTLLCIVGITGCQMPEDNTPFAPLNTARLGEPIRNFPYKAGVDLFQLENDHADCEIVASQRVPENLRTQTMPSFSIPERTLCHQFGTRTVCNQTGGRTIGGQIYSIDANISARRRFYEQCMMHRDYRFVTLPACPRGTDFSYLKDGYLFKEFFTNNLLSDILIRWVCDRGSSAS